MYRPTLDMCRRAKKTLYSLNGGQTSHFNCNVSIVLQNERAASSMLCRSQHDISASSRRSKQTSARVPCPLSYPLPTRHPLAQPPLSCVGRVTFLNLCFFAPFHHTIFPSPPPGRCKHADLLAAQS